jgi:hypothetical protein
MSGAVPKLARWIPLPARAWIEELWALPDLRPDHREILARLATDLRMRDVWKAIERFGEGKESDVIQQAFARSCQALAYKPPFPRRKKDKDKRVLNDATALSRPGAKIYDLADTAAYASMLVDAMHNTAPDAKAFLTNDAPASFEHLLNWATYIAKVYANLSARERRLSEAFPLPSIGKPAAKNAPERFFSAAMTNSFRELFDRPLDEAVAALTEVIFNSEDATGSTSIRGRRRSAQRRHIDPKK